VFLIIRRTPTAFDNEPDPIVRGVRRCSTHRTEQLGVKVDYPGNRLVKDGGVVGNGTVFDAKRTTTLIVVRATRRYGLRG
jgi:hypothetical protein